MKYGPSPVKPGLVGSNKYETATTTDVSSMTKRAAKLDDHIAWINDTVASLEKKLMPYLSPAYDEKGGATPIEQGASPLEDYFILATERLDQLRRRLQNVVDRVVV